MTVSTQGGARLDPVAVKQFVENAIRARVGRLGHPVGENSEGVGSRGAQCGRAVTIAWHQERHVDRGDTDTVEPFFGTLPVAGYGLGAILALTRCNHGRMPAPTSQLLEDAVAPCAPATRPEQHEPLITRWHGRGLGG